MKLPILLSVKDVADQCHVHPRLISDLFYQRHLDPRRCPAIGGRRVIPADYVPEIRATLQKLGKLPATWVEAEVPA
jgi:hypothetical protein